MPLAPTDAELAQRNAVMAKILECTRTETRIKLPEFDPARERPSDQFALINVGLEPNDFGGVLGTYRYQFEGEEDLLHLMITSVSEEPVSTAEAHQVASIVLHGVPSALVWLKPGEFSQHFYVGHDELLVHLTEKL
ncbi:MAG: hypothetical protein QE269_03940 [Fimbriimonas sp.]|jgi:hypothetical protein|nr:hypothetical protein [Fimbriimonas sp.]